MERIAFFVVDGSWTKTEEAKKSHCIGLGIVGCYAYEQEPFFVTSQYYNSDNGSSTLAEYQACAAALRYAQQQKHKHIVLVTDQKLSLSFIQKQKEIRTQEPWYSLFSELEELCLSLLSYAVLEIVCYSKQIGHLKQYINVQMFYKMAHLLSQGYKSDSLIQKRTETIRFRGDNLYELKEFGTSIPVVARTPIQGMIQLAETRHKLFPYTTFHLDGYEGWEEDVRTLFASEQVQTIRTLLALPVTMPNGMRYVTWKHVYQDFFSLSFSDLGLFEEPRVTHLSFVRKKGDTVTFSVQSEGAVRYVDKKGGTLQDIKELANERLGVFDTYQIIHTKEAPFFVVQTKEEPREAKRPMQTTKQ